MHKIYLFSWNISIVVKNDFFLLHLISTYSDVRTSGFPSFHVLSILANFFASKFSYLLTFISFTFPIFTQLVYFHPIFEKWTVKKSKFDNFQKVIFYSLPVVGQLHNFVFIIRGKLWEVVKNSKKPYLYQNVNSKKSWLIGEQKDILWINNTFFNVGKFWTSNLPRPPP